MTVLIQCPACNRRQSLKNAKCTQCALDLAKAQKSTRVNPADRVRYVVSFRDAAGKQVMESAGASLKDARALDAKRKAEARDGVVVPEKRNWTFENLTEWYLQQGAVQRLKSFKGITIRLGQFNGQFGKMRVSALKAADLKNYQAELAADGQAPGSVDQIIGKARSMVRAAYENDLIGPEPVKSFKIAGKVLVPGSDVRETVLSRAQYDQLMAHLPEHLKGVVACAFLCGMRRGEILCLTWDRVDLKGRTLRLEGRHTKSGQPRRIPLPDELVKILMAQPSRLQSAGDPETHVFTFRGKPIKSARKGVTLACQRAGITYGQRATRGFVFHDLRHSYVTHARKSGMSESVIMSIVGHRGRSMFDRYNLIDADDLETATKQLEDYFKAAL